MTIKQLLIAGLFCLIGSSLWASEKLQVIATIPDLGWMVEKIGGDAVAVKTLLNGNEDPHYVDATPKWVWMASKADVVVFAGLDLEIGWLPKILEQSANSNIQFGSKGYCEVGRFIDVLDKPMGPVDRSMGDVHSHGNPHFWLSPKRLAQGAAGVAAVLSANRPEKAAYFKANLEKFQSEMAAMQDHNKQQVQDILNSRIKPILIEYHKEFSYWAHDLNIPSFGAIEEKPGLPPSAGRLARVSIEAKKAGVQVAFVTPHSPKNIVSRFEELSGIPVKIVPASIMTKTRWDSYQAVQDQLIQSLKDSINP